MHPGNNCRNDVRLFYLYRLPPNLVIHEQLKNRKYEKTNLSNGNALGNAAN
jgi:hypothetical protein